MFYRWGRLWECRRGYAVIDPVGWWFDLIDVTDLCDAEVVLFASWSDDGTLIVAQHRNDVLPETVEWFAAEARNAICPIVDEPDTASNRDSM
jgi:hypothetical protein